ncbi:MAG: hypothetical protein ACYDH6_19685 [Acidimicrobiales bacterium]
MSSAPAIIRPGTYEYTQSGSTTVGPNKTDAPPNGLLVVDPPGSSGSQVVHQYIDPSQPPSDDTTLQFTPSQILLVARTTRTNFGGQSVMYTCTFEPPMPAPPWPPTVGASFRGHADCGPFTADVMGRVESRAQDILDGAPIEISRVRSSITTHGSIESTAAEVDDFAPTLRLNVRADTQRHGTYGFVEFSTNLSETLASGRPS